MAGTVDPMACLVGDDQVDVAGSKISQSVSNTVFLISLVF